MYCLFWVFHILLKNTFCYYGFYSYLFKFCFIQRLQKGNVEKEVFDSFSENSPLIEEIDVIETVEDVNNENFLEEDGENTNYNKDERTKER